MTDPPVAAPITRVPDADEAFAEFVAASGARLRRVLCAHFGIDVGADLTSDALAYAWEHWADVRAMANPVGYLYRVAQSASRRHVRWQRPAVTLPAVDHGRMPDVEPGLDGALTRLSPSQRAAVVLVHGLGWSQTEAAATMGMSLSTLRNHLRRGLDSLRRSLGGAR